jgi:hypothetical protein
VERWYGFECLRSDEIGAPSLKIGSWRLAPVEGEPRFSTTAVIATLQSGPSIKGKLTVDLELYSI